MTREEILAVVERHARQVLVDLPAEALLDPQRSLKEYGANSLDAVEIVSGSMRELRVKLPRAEIAKLKNVDDLVALLFKTQ